MRHSHDLSEDGMWSVHLDVPLISPEAPTTHCAGKRCVHIPASPGGPSALISLHHPYPRRHAGAHTDTVGPWPEITCSLAWALKGHLSRESHGSCCNYNSLPVSRIVGGWDDSQQHLHFVFPWTFVLLCRDVCCLWVRVYSSLQLSAILPYRHLNSYIESSQHPQGLVPASLQRQMLKSLTENGAVFICSLCVSSSAW